MQFILAVAPLVKSETSHRHQNEWSFSDPNTLQMAYWGICMNTNY